MELGRRPGPDPHRTRRVAIRLGSQSRRKLNQVGADPITPIIATWYVCAPSPTLEAAKSSVVRSAQSDSSSGVNGRQWFRGRSRFRLLAATGVKGVNRSVTKAPR